MLTPFWSNFFRNISPFGPLIAIFRSNPQQKYQNSFSIQHTFIVLATWRQTYELRIEIKEIDIEFRNVLESRRYYSFTKE